MPLQNLAIPAAVSPTATVTAPPISTTIAALAASPTAHAACIPAATATLPLALALALSLSLPLSLPGEGFRTDVTKRGFHGVRLRTTRRSVAPVSPLIAAA